MFSVSVRDSIRIGLGLSLCFILSININPCIVSYWYILYL